MLYPEFGSVCAVIVTHNIGEAFHANFTATLPQVDFSIIIDNGSTDSTLAVLERIKAENPGKVEILLNPENGLAKAQNMGITRAIKLGHAWVLLLDHDSRPEVGMVSKMIEQHTTLPDKIAKNIGILCPVIHDERLKKNIHYLAVSRWGFVERCQVLQTTGYDKALCVCASGSLIPMQIFTQVGLMDESLFIDYIDTDFCLRLHAKKFAVIIVFASTLNHNISELKQHTIGGLHIITTNNSASRRYYYYRNKIIIWKRFFASALPFILFDLIRSIYDMLRIGLYEADKKAKLCAILQGTWHGICGVTGKKPG